MFAERDKHYPSRSRQTSLATAVTNFTKPVTNINFGPSRKLWKRDDYQNAAPSLTQSGRTAYLHSWKLFPSLTHMRMRIHKREKEKRGRGKRALKLPPVKCAISIISSRSLS